MKSLFPLIPSTLLPLFSLFSPASMEGERTRENKIPSRIGFALQEVKGGKEIRNLLSPPIYPAKG
jgi:hypothetical protein